jgi:hypothetical protein
MVVHSQDEYNSDFDGSQLQTLEVFSAESLDSQKNQQRRVLFSSCILIRAYLKICNNKNRSLKDTICVIIFMTLSTEHAQTNSTENQLDYTLSHSQLDLNQECAKVCQEVGVPKWLSDCAIQGWALDVHLARWHAMITALGHFHVKSHSAYQYTSIQSADQYINSSSSIQSADQYINSSSSIQSADQYINSSSRRILAMHILVSRNLAPSRFRILSILYCSQ